MKFPSARLLVLLSLSSAPLYADFAPFDHDIQCNDSADQATSVTIIYDKNEHADLGRPGGIHIEINTGISELSHLGRALGIETPYRRVIRRGGPAGQVGNWIAQVKNDPLVAEVRTGFTSYDLVGADGKVEKRFNSFISHLTLSRVTEFGFHGRDGAETREFIDLRLLDDYGTHHMRFKPQDCRLLN